MLTKFQRPEECENYGRVIKEYIIKMEEVLDKLSMGIANLEKVKEFISSLINEQDEKGFFALIPNPEVPSDIRVLYWYEPTYIGAAIMMKFYIMIKI